MTGLRQRWREFWYKHDPDDVFAYTTIKMLKIRDRRLGILHYIFMSAVFIYIFGIVLLRDKRYLDVEAPIGSVAMSSSRDLPVDTTQLAYCSQDHAQPAPLDSGKLLCATLDPFSAVYPLFEETAIFFTTRISSVHENRSCAELGDRCSGPVFAEVGRNVYYVSDTENFKLHVSHSVQAPTFTQWRPYSLSYRGQSVNMAGHFIINTETGEERPLPAGSADVFSVQEFLTAAGVSLDDLSDMPEDDAAVPKPTFRYTGMVLVVSIIYRNSYPEYLTAPAPEITYTYRVQRVRQTMFRVFEKRSNETESERWIYDRHGIRIIFVQTGLLGRFQFQSLLIQLVTSMALLKVSTTIVDLIALRFMPQRGHYKGYKYELTADFSDLRDRLVQEDKKRDAFKKPLLLEKYGSTGDGDGSV